MEFLQYVLALIVTLGILVTFHELGHFVVARLSGVTIVRFSVGFGRPIWSWFDRRGTEFAVAAIPLGGYVRMLDEHDGVTEGVDESRLLSRADAVTHGSLPVWWRIAIALGGPVANFVLAFFVYWVLALFGSSTFAPTVGVVDPGSPAGVAGLPSFSEIVTVDGTPTRSWQEVNMRLAERLGESGNIEIGARSPERGRIQPASISIQSWHSGEDEPDLLGSIGLEPALLAIVGEVVPDSPAERGGLEPWDRIVSADGRPIETWTEWVEAVRGSPGRTLDLVVQRGEAQVTLSATPDTSVDAEGKPFGVVGVTPATREISYSFAGALEQAVSETGSNTALTLNLLRKMVFGQVSLKNLSGPITIAKVAGDSARSGLKYFLGVLALLSISLGVLNLLPIPILDGGHIVYFLAEVATGRPVSERVQAIGMQVGMFLVGGLMLLAFYNDITRLL